MLLRVLTITSYLQVLVDHTEHVLVHTLAVENKMCYTTWSNHE